MSVVTMSITMVTAVVPTVAIAVTSVVWIMAAVMTAIAVAMTTVVRIVTAAVAISVASMTIATAVTITRSSRSARCSSGAIGNQKGRRYRFVEHCLFIVIFTVELF